MVLASPSFLIHRHNALQGQCDRDLNPASYWTEAQSTNRIVDPSNSSASQPVHQHSRETTDATSASSPAAPATPDTNATGHPVVASFDHGRGSAELDALLSWSMTSGEVDLSQLVEGLASVGDTTYAAWLEHVNQLVTHAGPQYWTPMTNAADCQQLHVELDRARRLADRYPTAAQAKEAGYMMTASFVAGMGSHWLNFSLLDGKFDIDNPEILLYSGNDDGSRLIGLSYLVVSHPGITPTQGFTGDNDEYHTHKQLCRRENVIVGDSLTPDDVCRQLGGTLQREDDRFMMHVWLIPGCESPWGMFSAANPLIDNAVMSNPTTTGSPCTSSQIRHRYFPTDAAATKSRATPTSSIARFSSKGRRPSCPSDPRSCWYSPSHPACRWSPVDPGPQPSAAVVTRTKSSRTRCSTKPTS